MQQNLFTSRAIHLDLPAGATRALPLRAPLRARVRCGLVWLTVDAGGADVWLGPGREFDLPARGLAVFEAVRGCAQVELAPVPRGQDRASSRVLVSRLLPHGLLRW